MPASIPHEAVLELVKAAADPLRQQVLIVLQNESFSVGELSRIFDMPQPGMSHHLKILANAGLVNTRREGNSVFYRRALIPADSPVRELQQSLVSTLDQVCLPRPVIHRKRAVHRERATRSRAFFRKHATEFQRNQELIVPFADIEHTLLTVIDNEHLPDYDHAVEVGPGDGELLRSLGERFAHLTAIDNAAEMLERTRASCPYLRNTRFLLGELHDLAAEGSQADLVALNMVLHHVGSPADTIRDAAGLLNPGGALVLVDLNSHDQDWTREACGDVWLGFAASDLERWSVDAGLATGQSAYLGQRNGFQTQVRTFLKPAMQPTT